MNNVLLKITEEGMKCADGLKDMQPGSYDPTIACIFEKLKDKKLHSLVELKKDINVPDFDNIIMFLMRIGDIEIGSDDDTMLEILEWLRESGRYEVTFYKSWRWNNHSHTTSEQILKDFKEYKASGILLP